MNRETIEVTLFAAIISFVFGRLSTSSANRIAARKEIISSFLKPFLSLYVDTVHSVAVSTIDIPKETLRTMTKLLNDNAIYLSPRLQWNIKEFDMILSTYKINFYGDRTGNISKDESMYLDRLLHEIYSDLLSLYRKNSLIIYCSFWERIKYKLSNPFFIKRKLYSKKKENNKESNN